MPCIRSLEMSDILTFEAFGGCAGDRFRLTVAPTIAAEVELVEASDLSAGHSPAGCGSPSPGTHFSLVFRAPPGLPLAQGTYHLEHDRLGAVELFMVPIAADELGTLLEAIVNRLPPRGATP
jgi:hypothetical protein